MHRYRFWIAAASTLVVLLIGFGFWQTLRPAWPDAELVATKKQASYPIYYPSELPSGYTYQQHSAKAWPTVFIYTIVNGKNQVHVSVEPKPAGVQFDDFYNRVLTGKADVVSAEGKAVIGTANGELVGSLVTDKVWVILNAPSGVDTQIMQALLQKLKQL